MPRDSLVAHRAHINLIYQLIVSITIFQLADMVNLHFLNTIQALQQVNSALLCQLYSMWAPILTAYHSQIPNQLR